MLTYLDLFFAQSNVQKCKLKRMKYQFIIGINIECDGEKFGMIQKLSLLFDNLKKISSSLARYNLSIQMYKECEN